MSRVTLPSYPRGAPVVVLDMSEAPESNGPPVKVGDAVTVTRASSDSGKRWCIVSGRTVTDTGPAWAKLPAAALALDLTDPAGMDIAARWLAEKMKRVAVGATAPRWERRKDDEADGYVWVLSSSEYDEALFSRSCGLVPGVCYPADIGDILDPAEALALACLAVAR